MPRYETSFPIAWRLRGLNATLRDQPPHGLAIKGVKCQDTRPAFPMVWRIRELNTTVPDQHDPMSWRLKD
ncbi:TPA: hypothetical protein NU275_004270 [Escherichia coli]|nr:hypothetical protein [Escherichia coli]WBW57789.1 hypothetical protein DFIBIBGI_00297 [Escherichia coli]HCJ5612139.1 hypothetical protein [Escherichia coli]HCJ5791651.1 hypothetical protein [Escherichia coli]